jgi:hypothetical protein
MRRQEGRAVPSPARGQKKMSLRDRRHPKRGVCASRPSSPRGETTMILRYLCISLCLLGGASLRAQVAPPSGAWRQTNVTWKKPPAELELKQRYAEAAVLYFSPDQRFDLLYGTVIQGPASEGVSRGDGRVVCLGTWKLAGNSLHVEYRVVSGTVAKEGESLPGPVESEDVRVRGRMLLFQKDRFKRDEKLDDDMKASLQGESARQGTCKP